MKPEYYEGYDAYCDGRESSACPYKVKSVEGAEWLNGWREAKRTWEKLGD